LINHIMDEVCYNQAGNKLEMFKRVSHDAPIETHSSKSQDSLNEEER